MTGGYGLSATTYVVLGLVSIRPMTGYELAAYAERSIGNFFPLTRSHIYSELDRLGRLGLLEATEIALRMRRPSGCMRSPRTGATSYGTGWGAR
jgi:DNA-binding PadR family transcriptional regulator